MNTPTITHNPRPLVRAHNDGFQSNQCDHYHFGWERQKRSDEENANTADTRRRIKEIAEAIAETGRKYNASHLDAFNATRRERPELFLQVRPVSATQDA